MRPILDPDATELLLRGAQSGARFIDISVPLRPGMPVYEGDPEMSRVPRDSPPPSSAPSWYAMSELRLGSHTGTHVDAPRHLVAGAAGVDELLLEVLCGPARVADLRGAGMRLDARVLEESAARFAGERGGWPERLLLRTDTEALERGRFHRGYAHLTRDAAELLRDRGVRLVGIDSWSVDPWSDDEAFAFPAHHALLDPRADREPVVIVECLELSGAQQGDWELVCLPLRIEGGDGAPARAVLRRVG